MNDYQDEKNLELRPSQVQKIIDLFHPYLINTLLPFWLENSVDVEYGGFLTYFNRDGSRSGKTQKTLIMQLRMVFTFASVCRAGYGDHRFVTAAEQGIEFLLEHFWDKKYGGWYWIAERDGKIINNSKIMYGQSFGIYAMAESALAFNHFQTQAIATKTYDLIQAHAADDEAGGYWEMFEHDWTLRPGGTYGGDRKTLDVHMHLMEAFTTLYERTRSDDHKQKLADVIEILVEKMLEPQYGTGLAQFDGNFKPLPAIMFKNVWGSDRPTEEQKARPLDNTNCGHNIEMAWLLKHALDVLDVDPDPYYPIIKKLVDQAYQWGIDWEYGGIYVEGPSNGPATQTLKEFWQQAEALVGFLDAALIFKQQKYWDAFENVFDFVWNKMIEHEMGEWLPLLERDGTPKWEYLGHEWKISYHTVRAVIQTLNRLRQLKEKYALV